MEGWIKLHRQFLDHWLCDEFRPLTKREAWENMVFYANYSDNKVMIKGQVIECKRGQICYSLETYAKKFNWSIGQVRQFFQLLKNDGMIKVEGLKYTTRLTICNYDNYQDKQQTDNKLPTSSEQTDNKLPTTSKESKEVEKGKESKVTRYFESDRLNSLFSDFVTYRKQIKKPVTDRAIQLLKGQLQKLASDEATQCEIIEQSIMRGWQGFFELKQINGEQRKKVMP